MIDGLAKEPPQSPSLTDYDRGHFKLYLRLLDAADERADWREVVRVLFDLDPDREPESARRIYETHLKRAQWISTHGYKDLLKGSGT
jgi:Uncharacterized conserved protein (DUF2285)